MYINSDYKGSSYCESPDERAFSNVWILFALRIFSQSGCNTPFNLKTIYIQTGFSIRWNSDALAFLKKYMNIL